MVTTYERLSLPCRTIGCNSLKRVLRFIVNNKSTSAAAHQSSFLLIVATVIFGVLMAVMDQTIVNVAVSSIGGSLGASPDEAAWVATGYVLGMIVAMPLNGWLTLRFGEKRYYLGAFGLFTVASFFCGLCPTISTLIAARIAQGLGGGALQPIALSILLRTAPREQQANMVAAFAFASTMPFAVGGIIGGFILDNYDLSFPSWRMLFFFKVPLCVIGLIVAYFVLPESKEEAQAPPIQWPSFIALAVMLASLQTVLSEGQRLYWFQSGAIVVLTIVTVAALFYFVWAQLRAPRPFVNLRVFKTLSFSVGCVLSVVSGFGLYGINLVTPLFFQGPLHLTPYESGIFLLQGGLATLLVMPIIGPLTKRVDTRIVLGVALLMFAVGAWMMGSLNADAGYWDIFIPRVLQGIALGLLFVPLIAVTLSQIVPQRLSDATGIATLVRYLGGNVGIALLQVLQSNRASAAEAVMAGRATLQNSQVAQMVQAMGLYKVRLLLAGLIQSNADLVSYLYVFRISGILFALTIPLLLLLPNPRASGTADSTRKVATELRSDAPPVIDAAS